MSLFTVAIICTIFVSVFIKAFRGYKRGITYTLADLGIIILSVLAASLLSKAISDPVADLLAIPIFNLKQISEVFIQLPSLSELIPAYIDAIITPFLFLLLFVIIKPILSVCIRQILKNCNGSTGKYIDRPRQKKHVSLCGTLIGALCGLLCAVIIISPLLGTLNIACSAVDILEKNEKYVVGITLNKKEFEGFKPYSSDEKIKLIRQYSDSLFYAPLAVSSIGEENISLVDEIENIDSIMALFSEILSMLRDGTYSGEEKNIQNNLEKLSASPTFKIIAADFLSEASKAWLSGEKYMSHPKFSSGDLVDPLINEMLTVCTETTPETSIADLSTILNTYMIAIKSGLTSTNDYIEILEKINNGNILSELRLELEKNERMAYISDSIEDISLRALSFMIVNYEYEENEYQILMQEYASFLNSIDGYKYEERIEMLSTYTGEYIQSTFDLTVPQDVCDMLAEAMENEITTSDGVVRPSDVIKFFNSYS